MALILAGINHNTANVALREKVAFPPEIMADAIRDLIKVDGVEEAVILSTCNRTELYLSVNTGEEDKSERPAPVLLSLAELSGSVPLADIEKGIVDWLARFHGQGAAEIRNCSYFHWQDDVIRHLMRVCCGLDSMVLGEPQILGQIKSAYAISKELDVIGINLGRLFQQAFSIAKEVRTDTAIGENPVSVAYAAVALAERIFSDLSQLSALLIGAGRTIELVLRHLKEKGVKRIVVANRTLERAVELGDRFEAHGVLLAEIPEQLVNADIVVSSTNSQLPLLGKGAVERAIKLRRHKPMLLVDLAVPRDIEEGVGEIPDAYLYTVDDISGVIEDNVKSRAAAAAQAQSIIERGVADYLRTLRSLSAVETLKAFRSKAESISEAELEKALKALERGDAPAQVLESLARNITNKLMHAPTVRMKDASAEGRDELTRLIRELYDLDQQDSPQA